MSTVKLRVYNLVLTGTSSCLSLLGGGLIVVTYVTIPQVRNFTRRLLLYLTVADLLTAAGNLVATVRYAVLHREDKKEATGNCSELVSDDFEALCTAQSFVTTFSNMASFFWTLIIAFHLWSNVFLKSRMSENYFLQLVFHLVSWLLPFILVAVALHNEILGEDYCYGTGVWCGIKSNLSRHDLRMWMYVEDIAWQITCYIVMCFLYIHVKFYIALVCRNQSLSTLCPNLRDEDRNFIFVWMAIYLLKLWGLVRFFVTSYTPEHVLATDKHLQSFLDFLLLMQSYGASGQAFWNCVIFCFCDKTVRTRMKQWVCKNDFEGRPFINSEGRPLLDNSVTRST